MNIINLNQEQELTGILKYLNADLIFKIYLGKNLVIKSNKEKSFLDFLSKWTLLLESEIKVEDSLKILQKQVNNENLRYIIYEILKDLNEGKSLSESFYKNKNYFPEIFIKLIYLGQKSNQLSYIIKESYIYFEKTFQTKKRFSTLLYYPIFLISLLTSVFFAFVFFMIPSLEEIIFLNEDIIRGEIIKNFILWKNINRIFLIIFIFVISFIFIEFLKIYKGKKSFLIRIRKIKKLSQWIQTARFCRILRLLIVSKVNFFESLEIITKITDATKKDSYRKKLLKKIYSGENYIEIFEESEIFDQHFILLLKINKDVQNFEHIIKTSSLYYENLLNINLKKIEKLIEPISMLLIGGITLLIVSTMIIPILNLGNGVIF